jgi:carbonic anhydrase
VKHIVVLGHARCGGIRAVANATAPLSPGDFIGQWMSLIAPAAERVTLLGDGPDDLRPLEHAAIELSLSNLMTLPWIRARVERGELHLHGAFFGVADGVLLVRNPATGEFAPLVEGR